MLIRVDNPWKKLKKKSIALLEILLFQIDTLEKHAKIFVIGTHLEKFVKPLRIQIYL